MSTDFDLSFLIETFDAAPHPQALAGVLFADDFDMEEMPVPDELAPGAGVVAAAVTHDEAALQSARLLAFEDGRAAALAETAARVAIAAEASLGALTHALDDAAASARGAADGTAATLAASMLRILAAALPELCARHGAAEAQALADALLPMLVQQPRIVLRANPHTVPALRECVARHDAIEPGRISLVATDALSEGDVNIEWQDGAAIRDSATLCRDLAAMLAPLQQRAEPVGNTPAHHAAANTMPAGHRAASRINDAPSAAERELADAG